MLIVILLLGFVLGIGLGWQFGRRSAQAVFSHIRRALAEESRYWQDMATRNASKAAQAAEEAKTWADGCRQGREDVISMWPLLLAAQARPADPADRQRAVGGADGR